MPDIVPFCHDNTEIFYLHNFSIIDSSLKEKLEEFKIFQNNSNINVICFIKENYILVDISDKNINLNKYKSIIEICVLDENNKIKPVYLLCYYKEKFFPIHSDYLLKSFRFTLKKFLESLSFTQGNGIKLEMYEDEDVGIIYKISEMTSNQNYFANINTNNNT